MGVSGMLCYGVGFKYPAKIKSVKIDFTVEVSPRAAIIENGIAIRH
jgi:hypothetical protein